MQPEPSEAVVTWLNRQPAGSVWTTAITIFEIENGLQLLPVGKRRKRLEKALLGMIEDDLGGRILPFDTPAAMAAGAIAAALQSQGKSAEIRDVQIAGIARVRKALVATRNVKHFKDACDVVNPWQDV